MAALHDLCVQLKILCDELHALRYWPRPPNTDWRHHTLTLEGAMEQRAKCRTTAACCLKLVEALAGQFPDAWIGNEPDQSKYLKLKRSLATIQYWLHDFQRPFRGFKMPMDSDAQDQHDDAADVADWEDAERAMRQLADELRNHVDLEVARTVQPQRIAPLQPAQMEIVWRKLLHYVRDYRRLLADSENWNCGLEEEINKHARTLGRQLPFQRYEERSSGSVQGFWLRVQDAFASKNISFPIITTDGRAIRCDPVTKQGVLKVLETWESMATAELEAAPMPARPQHWEAMRSAPAELDLSDVLEGMDDEHSLPLPELARQIAALADDVDAGSFITDALRHNAADLSKAARLQFRDTSMERREVEPGRWHWVKRNPANRPMSERRLEHHLSQAVAVLSDVQDGRKTADAAAKLRAIANGIESNAPKPADPEPPAQTEPPAMPDDLGNGKRRIEPKGSQVTPDPVAVAVTMKVRDPKLTVRKAAEAVGMHYTVLQKDEMWQATVYRLRQQAKGNVRRGSKSSGGQIETAADDDEQDAEE